MNTYCEKCKCWHRPDGTKADSQYDGEEVIADGNRRAKRNVPKP